MKADCRHPWLNMAAVALFDLSAAGFFALGLCREQITGMRMLPLAAALLVFGSFDLLLLRTPKSLGKYLLLNLIPAVLWTLLLFRCTEFAAAGGGLSGETAGGISGAAGGSVFGRRTLLPAFPPGLLPRILLPVFGLILPARQMYIAAAGTEPKARILYVDGAAVLLILVRWAQHYLKRPDLDTVFFLLLCTIIFEILNILGERVERSAEAAAPAAALALTGVLLCVFAGLSAAAVTHGSAVSAVLVGAVRFLWQLCCRAVIFAVTMIGRFLAWIASLFPEAEYEMLPMEEKPQMVMALEEAMERPDSGLLVMLGIFFGILALVWVLRTFAGLILGRTGIGRQTVRTVRRQSRFRDALKALFRKAGEIFSAVFTVLFRGRSVPGLLLRAEWFGRRRLRGRKREETIREYLTRIAENTEDAGAAAVLADCGEAWLYGKVRPEVPAETIRRIRKAFPLL